MAKRRRSVDSSFHAPGAEESTPAAMTGEATMQLLASLQARINTDVLARINTGDSQLPDAHGSESSVVEHIRSPIGTEEVPRDPAPRRRARGRSLVDHQIRPTAATAVALEGAQSPREQDQPASPAAMPMEHPEEEEEPSIAASGLVALGSRLGAHGRPGRPGWSRTSRPSVA